MPNQDDSSSYTLIQCQLYDYVEIACMHHYHLDIELLTGEIISGKALTTRIKNKQEFIVISSGTSFDEVESETRKPSQSVEQEIRLDLIKSLTALDKNAEFSTVAIN